MKSLDHFLPSFLSKNGNFKTRDFSPLIKKRVLAGVEYLEFPQRVTVESIFFFNLEIVANLSISIFT